MSTIKKKHIRLKILSYASFFLITISLILTNFLFGNFVVNAQSRPTVAFIRAQGGTVTCGSNLSNCTELREQSGSSLNVDRYSWAHLELRNSGGQINPLIQAGIDSESTQYIPFCGPFGGTVVWGFTDGNSSGCHRIEVTRLGTPVKADAKSSLSFAQPMRGTDVSLKSTPLAWPKQVGKANTQIVNQLKANFPDTQGHWAETEIDALSSQGIITGYEDGSFRPDAPVTRAEFAAIVNKAFGNLAPGRAEQDFPDTTSHWGSTSIRTAYARGFISGYPDGSFQPEGKIRRVEAVAALASGLNLTGRAALDSFYIDANQICGSEPSYGWACNPVSAATSNGIRIQGPAPDQFKPSQQASRADIAVFIYQALQGGFGSTEGQSEVIIEPTSSEASWGLAKVTGDRVEVTVLGGVVNVGLVNDLKQASAGERYTIQVNDAAGAYDQKSEPLSAEERLAIANSETIAIFLDTSTWSPEVAPQLAQFQAYRDALLDSRGTGTGDTGTETEQDLRAYCERIRQLGVTFPPDDQCYQFFPN